MASFCSILFRNFLSSSISPANPFDEQRAHFLCLNPIPKHHRPRRSLEAARTVQREEAMLADLPRSTYFPREVYREIEYCRCQKFRRILRQSIPSLILSEHTQEMCEVIFSALVRQVRT